MSALWVRESFVNRTEGYRTGDAPLYETDETEVGEVYRLAQRWHGRCEGKVYVDTPSGDPMPVGWVFVKREKYEDTGEPYLLEAWVTVHARPDTVTRTPHYVQVGRA